MKKQLEAIVTIINRHNGYEAELGDETYLIRFSKTSGDILNNLVLMDDFGITWEPFKAYPTPCYCQITLENAGIAANIMMRIADAYTNGDLPMSDDGEGAGETYLAQKAEVAELTGRGDPLIGTQIGKLDTNDPGTALLLELREKFPEAKFYQPGSRIGSPITQINDMCSRCVITMEGSLISLSDCESFDGGDYSYAKYDLFDPQSMEQLIAKVTEKIK